MNKPANLLFREQLPQATRSNSSKVETREGKAGFWITVFKKKVHRNEKKNEVNAKEIKEFSLHHLQRTILTPRGRSRLQSSLPGPYGGVKSTSSSLATSLPTFDASLPVIRALERAYVAGEGSDEPSLCLARTL